MRCFTSASSFKRGGVWWKPAGPNLTENLKFFQQNNNNTTPNHLEPADSIQRNNIKTSYSYPTKFESTHHPFPSFTPRENFDFDSSSLPLITSHTTQLILKHSKNIDLLLEIRDARFPFGTENQYINQNLAPDMKKIVILNKLDLVSPPYVQKSREFIEHTQAPCIAASTSLPESIGEILALMRKMARPNLKTVGIRTMLIGLPNVGKSSIINSLKKYFLLSNQYRNSYNQASHGLKGKKAKTGETPNLTKKIQQYMVAKPNIYCLDTPGIMFPITEDWDLYFKLLSLGNLSQIKVEEVIIADWILFYLNKNHNYTYVPILGLDGPSNDIKEIASHISLTLNANPFVTYISDITHGCRFFIDLFRTGKFGYVFLDNLPTTN